MQKILVLAAGVDRYEAKSGLSELSGAANDGRGFAKRFRATAEVQNVPAGAVRALTRTNK